MSSLVGALLAGGTGSRLGGDKALAPLNGRPMAAYAYDVLKQITDKQVFVAKADTKLPDLGIETWIEPDGIRHPLAGIAHALREAQGPIVVLAADMPLMTAPVLGVIAGARGTRVAQCHGRLQPLCARYELDAVAGLSEIRDGDRLTERILDLRPEVLEIGVEENFLNVNTPDDLAEAERLLSRRSTTWSAPAARSPRR